MRCRRPLLPGRRPCGSSKTLELTPLQHFQARLFRSRAFCFVLALSRKTAENATDCFRILIPKEAYKTRCDVHRRACLRCGVRECRWKEAGHARDNGGPCHADAAAPACSRAEKPNDAADTEDSGDCRCPRSVRRGLDRRLRAGSPRLVKMRVNWRRLQLRAKCAVPDPARRRSAAGRIHPPMRHQCQRVR